MQPRNAVLRNRVSGLAQPLRSQAPKSQILRGQSRSELYNFFENAQRKIKLDPIGQQMLAISSQPRKSSIFFSDPGFLAFSLFDFRLSFEKFLSKSLWRLDFYCNESNFFFGFWLQSSLNLCTDKDGEIVSTKSLEGFAKLRVLEVEKSILMSEWGGNLSRLWQ